MGARLRRGALAGALLLAGCTHSEDRRWQVLLPIADVSGESGSPEDNQPTLRVYSIPTVVPSAGKTRLRDLSPQGQQALIEAMSRRGVDPAKLRAALAAPLEGGAAPDPTDDRTQVQRTLIVSVNKPWNALPGDRLVRTVVTIRPHREANGSARFEFAGYTIAATDNKTLDIAQLETQSQASLSATLAPKIGGFGDNSVGGSVSRSHKTTADIQQQYENLSVDIVPDELVITRESERGLDVVGNTFVELTLAPPSTLGEPEAFIAASETLYDGAKPLRGEAADLDIKRLNYLPACSLRVDAEMKYLLRHVVSGREYYTEGKQTVSLIPGRIGPSPYSLARPSEAQAPLFQVVVNGSALSVRTPDGAHKPLLFDSFEDARRMAAWLQRGGGGRIGKAGLQLQMGGRPLPRGGQYIARHYTYGSARGCEAAVQ